VSPRHRAPIANGCQPLVPVSSKSNGPATSQSENTVPLNPITCRGMLRR